MSTHSMQGLALFRVFRGLILACLVLGSASRSQAANVRHELLRLVPEDVGFCLLVEDLRDHFAALGNSPFVKSFTASPFGSLILSSPEVKKLAEVDTFLQSNLQVSWAQLRDEVFGDGIAFAYRPGPPGKPDEEQGLILLRPRAPQLLARLLDDISRAQKQSGDLLGLEERQHSGIKYFCRVEKKETNFYCFIGDVLAFSTREEMLWRAIELSRQSKSDEPAIARQLRLLGIDKRLLTLWINPRAFDADLASKSSMLSGPEGVALKTLLSYWKALEGVGLSLAVQEDVQVMLTLRVRTDALPAVARRFFTEAARPSELWDRVPDTALLAVAGRFDLPALVEMLGEFVPEDSRKIVRDAVERGLGAVLGKDVFQEILPALGPDWGLCLLAPLADDKGWFPILMAAYRVRPLIDTSLFGALNSFATLAVLQHNQTQAEPMSLRTTQQGSVEVRSLVNASYFPPGCQPSFALKEGYLLLASSPEAIRRFRALGTATALAGEVPVLRASLKSLAQFLKERQGELIDHLVSKKALTKEEATKRLLSVQMVLQHFDRVEVTQRTLPGLFSLALRVRMAQSLR